MSAAAILVGASLPRGATIDPAIEWWWDASVTSSTFAATDGSGSPTSSGVVGYVLDQSGKGRHASAAADAKRPTLQLGGTGSAYRELSFGGGTYLRNLTNVSADECTIFLVGAHLSGGFFGRPRTLSAEQGDYLWTASSGSLNELGTYRGSGVTTSITNNYVGSAYKVVAIRWAIDTDTSKRHRQQWTNGVSAGTSLVTVGTTALNAPLFWGALYPDGFTATYNANEILFFSRALSDVEIAARSTALMAKWGIS